MKDLTFNSNETKFLDAVQGFFDNRTVINHLIFMDKWIESLLGGEHKKRWTRPADLYYFYERIEALFEASYQLYQSTDGFENLKKSARLSQRFLETEKQVLTYFPYQLKEQLLQQPLKVLRSVFKKQDLKYHQQTLREWVAEGLNDNCAAENTNNIMPLYKHTKTLIVTCWLIHERVITQNSFKKPSYPNPLLNFALTEPSLFDTEELDDPFAVIEFFFNFTNLSGYRAELQKCFMAAIIENMAHESANTLLFMHNQYTSLIQAGYLIASKKIDYVPQPNKYAGKTLGQWLFSVRDLEVEKGEITLSDEEPHVLSLAERAAPMDYCREALSHDKVIKLRYGLKEWLDAGLSENSSINGIGDEYAFELYLTLQKLTEAFYLIITENAKTPILTLTDVHHEA